MALQFVAPGARLEARRNVNARPLARWLLRQVQHHFAP